MNSIKTAFLLAGLTAILAAFGMLLDRAMGTGGLMFIIFCGIGIVMNWVSYFHSDKLVLRLYGAQVVSEHEAPQLHQIVDRLCARTGLPKPKVCIIPTDVPNAFATGRDPQHAAVACTEGILRTLSYQELEGVIAHELGHIRNRDTLISTVAASIAGAIGMLANMGQFGLMFGGSHHDDEEGGGNPFVLLIMMFLAPLIAVIVQMAISRTREFGADRAAAEMTGNPDALASALRRLDAYAHRHPLPVTQGTQHLFIINPLAGGFGSWFSTHPPTEARVAALERVREELTASRAAGRSTRTLAPGF